MYFFPVPHATKRLMTEVAFLTSDMSTAAGLPTYDITLPTVLDGDVAVIGCRVTANSGTPDSSTPSGWELVYKGSNIAGVIVVVFWKVLTAADSGQTVSITSTGGSGTRSVSADMVIFRPDTPAASVSLQSMNGNATSGNPPAQTITSGSGSTPSVVAYGYMAKNDQNNTNSGGTLYTNADAILNGRVSGGNFLMQTAYEIFNTSPADRTWDAPDTGAGTGVVSFYLQFNPE